MALSRSLTIPALLALATAVVIGGFLLWQLDTTRAFLQRTPDPLYASGTSIRAVSPLPSPLSHGDAALSALRRGDLLALRGEWTEAEQEYQAAAAAGGGLTALRKVAHAQMQRRDSTAARETLQKLRSAGARDEDLLLLESIITLRSGALDEARRLLTTADESPQRAYGLALMAIIEGRHDDARAALALTLGGWEPTLRSYAKILLGAYEEYDLFTQSPETHRSTLLARALADVGECELALPLLQNVLAAQDDYRDAWIVQGYCQLTTERLTEAKSSLERAYAIDPQKPEISYFLARANARLGDHPGAITYVQYAIENGFAPVREAKRLLAAEAFAVGDTTLAVQALDDLTHEDDANVDAFSDFITVALSIGHAEEAYAGAQEAVRRFPESAVAYDLLGTAAQETDRIDEARTAFTKALELDPSLDSARDHLHSL